MRSSLLFLLVLSGCREKDPAYCDAKTACPAGQRCLMPERECARDCGISCPCLTSPAAGPHFQYATSAISISGSGSGLDVDGDGRPDNQLGQLVALLRSIGADAGAWIDSAVKAGRGLLVIDVQTSAPGSGCARLVLASAEPSGSPPRFNGSDVFRVSAAAPVAALIGDGDGTIPPPMLKDDQVQRLQFLLPFGAVTFMGIHVRGQFTPDGVMKGRIHGVVLAQDVERVVIPGLAVWITELIHDNPTSSSLANFLQDRVHNPASRDKCRDNPSDCCGETPASRMTCRITPEEVRTNWFIGPVLEPDVQVLQDGRWAPLPQGAMADAWSVGIGFTAVRARF
jgi:hypothetical protein